MHGVTKNPVPAVEPGAGMNSWSPTMQVMVRTSIHSRSAISTFWGEALLEVYNEAFSSMMGLQHPSSVLLQAEQVWGDKWPELEPILRSVYEEGRSLLLEDYRLKIQKQEKPGPCYVTLSLSPIYNDIAAIEGVLLMATETTALVRGLKENASGVDVPGAARNIAEAQAKNKTLPENGYAKAVLPGAIEESDRSNEKYHEMVDEVQDYAIMLLDNEGFIKNWNKGGEKITQYTASEAVGNHFSLFYLSEDRKNNIPGRLLELARENGRAVQEGWRLRKDQSGFWGSITLTALHDKENNVIGFTKVTRDLSDKKMADDQVRSYLIELQQVNESLRKSEERYQMMVEEVQDYAIILLDEKANIINWNAGAEAIKGYRGEEVIGKNIRIFYTEIDKENMLPEKLFKEASEKGKASQEGWRLRKDGTAFWGSISITALHNKAGTLIGFSKVTRDLTLRKQAEDRMRDYLAELESKNRELEQFAYLASHDLQEPLRKIRVFTEMLQTNFDDEALTKIYFQKIVTSATRMSELIQSVLNYCGLTSTDNEMVETDLNVILQTVKVDLELLIQEKNAYIDCQTLPVISAIPMFVTQLFTNLITNAIKFSQREPKILIASRMVSREQESTTNEKTGGKNYLEISFADNGIGFDEKYLNQIFSIFQRLHGKNEYPGVGIGLALCKKIMELHSGFITAKSELSNGSVFYVYFPAA